MENIKILTEKLNKKLSIRQTINQEDKNKDKINSKQNLTYSKPNIIQMRHASIKIDGVADFNDLNELKNQMELN